MDKIYKIGNNAIDLSKVLQISDIEASEAFFYYSVFYPGRSIYFDQSTFAKPSAILKFIKERDRLVSAWEYYRAENLPPHAPHANPHVTPQPPIYTFEIGTIDLSKITVIRGSRPKTDTKYLLEVFLKNGYSVAWRFKKKEDITRIKTQLTEAWKNYKNT